MKKRLGVFLMVCTLAVSMVGCGEREKETDKKGDIESQDTTTEERMDYTAYTADVPREERDIEYYWNINTETFDKTKFDGRISVFGTIMDEKLTGKSLKDAGFTFVSWASEDGDATEQAYLDYEEDEGYCTEFGLLYKDGRVFPTYNYNMVVYMYNYHDNCKVYDEMTEMYFCQRTTINDVENVVVPYMEGVEYSKLTIDDIIDHLGAPTYVEQRETELEDSGEVFGAITFNYVYVYDDYTFIFDFIYYENTGITVTDLAYMGSETYAQPVEVFDYEASDTITYDSYEEFLEKQQNAYLEAIGAR